MDEVILDDKTYIASKKAALEFGYTQDYVGQLCRKGLIDAKRVSGQWYVFLESLKNHKANAETFKPEPPKYEPDPNVESTITVEGKEFVSAPLAAKLAQYNQDYVGQLARAGKIPSRQIGNRWYVERTALLQHKEDKDAMLRAVQAESVGLKKPDAQNIGTGNLYTLQKPVLPQLMTYKADNRPLFLELSEAVEEHSLKAVPMRQESAPIPKVGTLSRIPIRVLKQEMRIAREEPAAKSVLAPVKRSVAVSEKSMFLELFWKAAFGAATIALVVYIGYQGSTIYANLKSGDYADQTAATGSIHGSVIDNISNALAKILTKELGYVRK